MKIPQLIVYLQKVEKLYHKGLTRTREMSIFDFALTGLTK